jgi:hypothetical protein
MFLASSTLRGSRKGEPPVTDKKKPDDKKKDEPEYTMKDVVQAIQILAKQVKGIEGDVTGIKSGTVKIKGAEPKPKSEKKETVKKADLEELSREELVDYILNTVKTAAIDPLVEEQKQDRQKRDSEEVRGEIKKIAEQHPDFWEYEAEMRDLAQKHPTLSVDELYSMAQKKNPDKAAQIKEAADKKAAEKKEKEDEIQEPEFTGLLPTSGKATESTNMKKEDAAEKAWEKSGVDQALAAANME